jgi:multiple sugar transport system ATP-binding protein
MSELRLDSIHKRYRNRDVLETIDLTVEDGEFCVLLGPSGSGKSTLLNIIAGLTAPDAGRVMIDGRDVTRLAASTRDVSMVFQSYALYPNLTVAENIAFPLRARGMRRSEAASRVAATAEILRIADLLRRKPWQLSGGQQQRVAIGRALVRRSSLFLLDEPLSSLDATLRAELRSEIKRLHRVDGRTTIYVTHDQIEAMTLADRIAVLDNGRLLQVDRPQAVYERPVNRRVARLVGTRDMNFLEGNMCLCGGAPGIRASSGNWHVELPNSLRGFREGRPAVIGFRPEHGELLPPTARSGIPAEIATIEYTGPDCYAVAAAEGREITVRVERGHWARPPANVRISPNTDYLNIFCRDSGARLN